MIWDLISRGREWDDDRSRLSRTACFRNKLRSTRLKALVISATVVLLFLLSSTRPISASPFPGKAKKKETLPYGEGIIINIPLPEAEVAQAVEDVAQNTIIRGTKEYNKDEYVSGAAAADSTPAFPSWTEDGKVVYKVRNGAIDPRNFKEAGDVGTLAVRYVVQPQGEKNTVLRINAVFVEDFKRTIHASNGSVENAEYQDIRDRLQQVELVKQETAEALEAKAKRAATKPGQSGSPDSEANTGMSSSRQQNADPDADATSESGGVGGAARAGSSSTTPPTPSETVVASVAASKRSLEQSSHSQLSEPQLSGAVTVNDSNSATPLTPPPPSSASSPPWEASGDTLEQHVAELRREVERLVKQPGAPLKTAPYRTSSTLKSLRPGTDVLIVISTPYWYGVETHDGDHGWMRRDELELVK